MIPYPKPSLTYDQQIKLLMSRGLIITDPENAKRFLGQVNYYRFSAYCLPFETSRHQFMSNVKFEDIKSLYEFDRHLRFLIDEALEVIEISLRSLITYYLVHKYGPFAHEQPSTFYCGFDHASWIAKVHEETLRSRETFIKHFKDIYEGFPALPLWMAVEIMSFGSLSQLYSYLLKDDQIAIAKSIGYHSAILSSWLHTFTYVRNICAHHSRIWNKELAIPMKVPRGEQWHDINVRRIGSVIFAIIHYLRTVSVDESIKVEWCNEITELLSTKLSIVRFYEKIGLPENFKDHSLWQIK
jgi:abortive infection bacteriophage resistance protein